MGCFIGCFGLSSRRKRRKPPNHQKYVTYRPLPSSNFDTVVKPLSLDSENSEKRSVKIGKKVSFNLNVQAYEPIQNTYNVSESDKEENKEETFPLSQLKSTIQKTASYPSGYRYQNCSDCYDEDDEIAYEESDLGDDDDDDDDEYDCDSDIDEEILDQEEMSEHLCASTDGDLKCIGRDRCNYLCPVLNPVENLAQWKAIKARAGPPKYQRKENIPIQQESVMGTKTSLTLLPPCDSAINTNLSKPLLQEAAVDASLSNWLALSNCHQSSPAVKGSRVSDKNMLLSSKTRSNDSHSRRSREDGAILDIINLEIK